MKHVSSLLLVCVACSAPAGQGSPATRSTEPPPSSGPSSSRPAPSPPRPPGDQATDCPAIQIKAPDAVSEGTQARISAILAGGPRSPQINWNVSAGRIASGQRTPELVVDTRGLSGASITVTLEIGGLSTQCATNTASTSILVGPP